MAVHVVEIRVAVSVRMADAVGMLVFVLVLVLVKHDLQSAIEARRNACECREAWHVVAGLKPRDHRFGHAEPDGELLLSLAALGAQGGKLQCKFCRKYPCGAEMSG